tara:strand:- start:39 stop:227 length:189 start_codon:yes stop_codon:yes gene_type:complete
MVMSRSSMPQQITKPPQKRKKKMPLTSKQKKLARMAPPKNKITGADFKKLKKKKTKKVTKNA